mmetsp:Transcript_24187/g.52786  ORF Transcript_24187/g.52786 Transcript_24187/m.52786 type:complete len:305 (+) Transcript_24187:621-1535(+)
MSPQTAVEITRDGCSAKEIRREMSRSKLEACLCVPGLLFDEIPLDAASSSLCRSARTEWPAATCMLTRLLRNSYSSSSTEAQRLARAASGIASKSGKSASSSASRSEASLNLRSKRGVRAVHASVRSEASVERRETICESRRLSESKGPVGMWLPSASSSRRHACSSSCATVAAAALVAAAYACICAFHTSRSMPAISSVAPLNAAESSARRSSVGISPTSPQTSLISWVRATRAICRCVARAPAVPSACNSFTIPGHRAGHSCLASSTSSKASDSRTRCGSVSKSPSPWSTKPSTCRRSALCV